MAVQRIIDRLGPFLALAPARGKYGPDTVLIVDGTLVPTRDHTVAASSNNQSSKNVLGVLPVAGSWEVGAGCGDRTAQAGRDAGWAAGFPRYRTRSRTTAAGGRPDGHGCWVAHARLHRLPHRRARALAVLRPLRPPLDRGWVGRRRAGLPARTLTRPSDSGQDERSEVHSARSFLMSD